MIDFKSFFFVFVYYWKVFHKCSPYKFTYKSNQNIFLWICNHVCIKIIILNLVKISYLYLEKNEIFLPNFHVNVSNRDREIKKVLQSSNHVYVYKKNFCNLVKKTPGQWPNLSKYFCNAKYIYKKILMATKVSTSFYVFLFV